MPTLLRKILRRAVRPVARVYYPLCFGRHFPFAAACGRLVRRLEAHGAGGDLPQPRAAWEAQYGAGAWAFLRSAGELSRYGVLLAFVVHHAGARSILDVGCGEGVLRDLLREDDYDRYVGVDLAATAIAAARERARGGDRLVVADAEVWAPGAEFDAVVMNECLYYFHDPLAQARRYFDAVRAGGVLVVSMFESPRTRAILRVLERRLPRVERVRIETAKGAWSVAVFRRRSG